MDRLNKEIINRITELNRAFGYRDAIIDVLLLTKGCIDIKIADQISLLPEQKYPMEKIIGEE